MSSRGLNRRGHLSTKIPNVKLRPSSSAAPRKKREDEPMNAMDAEMLERHNLAAEDEDVSSAALRSTRRPWDRVVITFTGVDDKPRLSELAKQLGASIEMALTKDTTHVVASGFGSAKYLYAVEHRIPVMRPEWIDDTHARWINAEEVDYLESMEGKKLLCFTDLTISLSGVEDLDHRKFIIEQITSNGGKYSKDLDKHSTHLVSVQPTNIRMPSAKVKWACRQLNERDAQRRAGKRVEGEDMKIVYEDWIWDCIGFEGRWKEDWYDARKVRRPSRSKFEEVANGEAKQKMVQAIRIEPVSKDEPAVLKKRKRNNMDNLVGDLISTTAGSSSSKAKAGPTTEGMDIDEEPVQSEIAGSDTGTGRREVGALTAVAPQRKASILHSSRTNSFGPSGPSRLSHELRTESASMSSLPGTAHPPRQQRAPGEPARQIYAGKKCAVFAITSDTRLIEDAMNIHGGQLISHEAWEAGERVDYIVVRLYTRSLPDLSAIPEEDRPQIVSDLWVESCCFEATLLPLDSHFAFRPLTGSFPIPGADKCTVHITGWQPERGVIVKRLAKVIGLKIGEKMNRATTHLVTIHATGKKVDRAKDWDVSVVTEKWILAMAQSGKIEPDDQYRHGMESPPAAVQEVPEISAPTVVEREKTEGPEEEGVAEAKLAERASEDVEMAPASSDRKALVPKQSAALLSSPVGPAAPTSPHTVGFRKLKLTPTHVDPIPAAPVRTTTSTSTGSGSLPLSPPNQETERMLNQATGRSPARRLHSEPERLSHLKDKLDAESIESRLSRNSSAPAPISSPAKGAEPIRSTSLVNLKTSLGRPEMSEMLKLLAQPAGPSSSTGTTPPVSRSTKPLRRARPSGAPGSGTGSRLRTSMAFSTSTADKEGSEAGDVTTETTLRFSNSPPPYYAYQGGMGGGGPGGMEDESMRVNYVDPIAEKEKRRLVEAMRRGARASGSERGGPSPDVVGNKKRRKA